MAKSGYAKRVEKRKRDHEAIATKCRRLDSFGFINSSKAQTNEPSSQATVETASTLATPVLENLAPSTNSTITTSVTTATRNMATTTMTSSTSISTDHVMEELANEDVIHSSSLLSLSQSCSLESELHHNDSVVIASSTDMSDSCTAIDKQTLYSSRSVSRGDPCISEIDSSVKNKFRWAWLEESCLVSGERMSFSCFSKIAQPGKVECSICRDKIDYSNSGKKALAKHLKYQKHQAAWKAKQNNMRLDKTHEDTVCLGGPPNLKFVPLSDRVANAQATILSVIAEHSLPLSISPVLIDLAKELSKDTRMLQSLSMDRTSASYKLNHGLKKTILEETVMILKNHAFSLNIDEATSKTHKRILGVLVSFWSPTEQQIVVEHLGAIELTTVNSETLYEALVALFEKYGIPWSNLLAIMMDSCSVMRGTKSGLETLIRRRKAPHLLDIDGDSCHHIHNAVKILCKPFKMVVEKLLTDVYNDHCWSVDLRDILSKMCDILSVRFTRPENYVPHRWLSVYDVSVDTVRLWDAYVLCYYAFLNQEESNIFRDLISDVLDKRDLSDDAIQLLEPLWKQLKMKSRNFTEKGKERKKRICDKIFTNNRSTLLIINFYVSIMPLLKSYVVLFQSVDPMIHKLHDNQERAFRDFLSCFVKPSYLFDCPVNQLQVLKFEPDVLLKHPFIGDVAQKIIHAMGSKHPVVIDFQQNVIASYESCASYLQSKLPLSSTTLRTLSCLDPLIRGSNVLLNYLTKLKVLVPQLLTEEKSSSLTLEIHRYASCTSLPDFDDESRIDKWWNEVRNLGEFPVLSEVALALLSIFHGPQIESSFNVMGDILHAKSSNTGVDTYESYQVVKYHLRTSKKTGITLWAREDARRTPVNASLCRNIKMSSSVYRKQTRGLKTNTLLKSKTQEKAEFALAAKRNRKDFIIKKYQNLMKARKLARSFRK